MDTILQGLQAIEGVLGAVVIDPTGRIVNYKAHSVYDSSLLEEVSRGVANTIDSIQLLHEDWECVTTTFSDGRVMIRNLSGGCDGSLRALLVIADGRLNSSFAGVALRVAAAKLKNLGTAPAPGAGLAPTPSPPDRSALQSSSAMGSTPRCAPQINRSSSTLDIATSGLSWSGVDGASGLGASGVTVTDASSATYLTVCTKALAYSVGPMAKAFVKEAVHKLWPDRPFSRELGAALIAELEGYIENKDEIARFRKTMKSA